MPRLIRIWEKKRGQRRTGSKLVGSLGETIFFGALLLLGVLLMVSLLTSRLADSVPHGAYQSQLAFWLVVLVLLSFIVIGGSGTFYAVFQVGTSVERRSSFAQRAANIDLIREALPTTKEFPAIPRDTNLTNSPGIRLAYRLPIEQSSAWRLAATAAFALIWNAITIVLSVIAIHSQLHGEADTFLMLFVIPFLMIGLWAIYQFVRQLVRQTGVGPTNVEISDHPLLPGRDYEVYVTQAGSRSLKRLSLSLVCAEEASYTQGTDVRTETQVVSRQKIFRQEDIRIEASRPFEHQCEFRVPGGAMHSFQSGHNAIHWRLVVRGKPLRWRSFQRSFPVIVYPRTAGARSGGEGEQ